jgi:hypothetical protein
MYVYNEKYDISCFNVLRINEFINFKEEKKFNDSDDSDGFICRMIFIGIGSQMSFVANKFLKKIFDNCGRKIFFPPSYIKQYQYDRQQYRVLKDSEIEKKFSLYIDKDNHHNATIPISFNEIFITFGYDYGIGPKRASIIAKSARDRGIIDLIIGMTIMPFDHEKRQFLGLSHQETKELSDCFDALIVLNCVNSNIDNFEAAFLENSFGKAHPLYYAARAIHYSYAGALLIGIDYLDVKSWLKKIVIGEIGYGKASRNGIVAVKSAISTLYNNGNYLKNATSCMVTAFTGPDATLQVVGDAHEYFNKVVNESSCDVLLSAPVDYSLGDKIKISIISNVF